MTTKERTLPPVFNEQGFELANKKANLEVNQTFSEKLPPSDLNEIYENEPSLLDRYNSIVEQYYNRVFRYLLTKTLDEQESEDLTQDTFLRVFKALPKYQYTNKEEQWVFRIALNVFLDYSRRKKIIQFQNINTTSRSTHDRLFLISSEKVEHLVVGKEAGAYIVKVLDQMKPRYQKFLILKEFYGFSCREIAKNCGTTNGAVKSALIRAREKFTEIYNELDPPELYELYE